jgi:hypothetical protein
LEGYKQAKRDILNALDRGNYQHESRGDIDVKNLLATGKVTAREVADLIAASDGTMHTESAFTNRSRIHHEAFYRRREKSSNLQPLQNNGEHHVYA